MSDQSTTFRRRDWQDPKTCGEFFQLASKPGAIVRNRNYFKNYVEGELKFPADWEGVLDTKDLYQHASHPHNPRFSVKHYKHIGLSADWRENLGKEVRYVRASWCQFLVLLAKPGEFSVEVAFLSGALCQLQHCENNVDTLSEGTIVAVEPDGTFDFRVERPGKHFNIVTTYRLKDVEKLSYKLKPEAVTPEPAPFRDVPDPKPGSVTDATTYSPDATIYSLAYRALEGTADRERYSTVGLVGRLAKKFTHFKDTLEEVCGAFGHSLSDTFISLVASEVRKLRDSERGLLRQTQADLKCFAEMEAIIRDNIDVSELPTGATLVEKLRLFCQDLKAKIKAQRDASLWPNKEIAETVKPLGAIVNVPAETAQAMKLSADFAALRLKLEAETLDQMAAEIERKMTDGSKVADSGVPPPIKPDPPTVKESVLEEANRLINGKRQDDYGTPEDNFGVIGQLWTAYLRAVMNKRGHTQLEPRDVAYMMILLKIGRSIEKGTRDNCVDGAGYFGCAAKIEGHDK